MLALDRGRIAVARGTRQIAVRSLQRGHTVTITLHARPDAVFLWGTTLAVQHRHALTLYSLTTRRPYRTFPLARDGGEPRVSDVEGGHAVYLAGQTGLGGGGAITIHLLRLSGGRDTTITPAGGVPPFDAQLEPGGLYLSWNVVRTKRPGRVGSVPRRGILSPTR